MVEKEILNLPIHRNGAEVEDRGGAAHDVKSHPNIAELVSKYPESLQVVGYGKDHDQTSYKKVADG